jgi:hypothetical protein
VKIQIGVFWVVTTCRVHPEDGMDGDSKNLQIVFNLPHHYAASQTRRPRLENVIDIPSVVSEIKRVDGLTNTTSSLCIHFMLFFKEIRKGKTQSIRTNSLKPNKSH